MMNTASVSGNSWEPELPTAVSNEALPADLSPARARRLAGRLLAHAAAVEASDPSVGADLPASRIVVDRLGDSAYSIQVRGHHVVVDPPTADGGSDTGPTPIELFAASPASCVAYYAGRYLARHGVTGEGLRVEADFAMAADRPARVGGLRLNIAVPEGLEPGRHEALLAVASHCTVHNTLQQPPAVEITLISSEGAR